MSTPRARHWHHLVVPSVSARHVRTLSPASPGGRRSPTGLGCHAGHKARPRRVSGGKSPPVLSKPPYFLITAQRVPDSTNESLNPHTANTCQPPAQVTTPRWAGRRDIYIYIKGWGESQWTVKLIKLCAYQTFSSADRFLYMHGFHFQPPPWPCQWFISLLLRTD